MNYLGSGRLFALLDGHNIQYLCTYGSPSFLQTSCSEALVTHHEGQICHAQTPAISSYNGKITQIDALLDTCLVRYLETTKPIEISLILPGYCRIYPYPHLKHGEQNVPAYLLRIPMGIPAGFGCSATEERLLITIVGDAVFSNDGRAIRVSPGRCAILFVNSHPNKLHEDIKNYLALLDAPHFTQSAFYQRAKNPGNESLAYRSPVADTLLSLFCHTGGVISGHGENCVYTADLAIVGQALLHTKYKDHAIAVAEFLLSLWKQYNYLPLYASATHPCNTVCEKTDTESTIYPSVGLFFHALIEDGVKPRLKAELEKSIVAMANTACRHTVAGELGFCPLSFSMRRGDIAPEKLSEASALATAELLYLLTLYPSHRANVLRQTALTHLKTDFPAEEMRVSDRHRLARCRLPATLYGPCPACGDFTYVGWLTRAKFGAYLCPACYGKGMREWPLAANDAILPGTYATYLYYLYKAKVIDYRALCQGLDQCAVTASETIETISFYELCLLLPILDMVGSPHHAGLAEEAEKMLARRTRRPLFAAEAAAYLLAKAR